MPRRSSRKARSRRQSRPTTRRKRASSRKSSRRLSRRKSAAKKSSRRRSSSSRKSSRRRSRKQSGGLFKKNDIKSFVNIIETARKELTNDKDFVKFLFRDRSCYDIEGGAMSEKPCRNHVTKMQEFMNGLVSSGSNNFIKFVKMLKTKKYKKYYDLYENILRKLFRETLATYNKMIDEELMDKYDNATGFKK